MAQEQSSKNSLDFLNTLNVQQLRQILLAELESEEANVELIRNITSVLAAKDDSFAHDIDPEASYKAFVETSAQEEPLYDEVLSQMDTPAKTEPGWKRFSRLAKVAIIALCVVAILSSVSAVAYAMGFNIWGAISKWTEITFGYQTRERDGREDYDKDVDYYTQLRELLAEYTSTDNLVPRYKPKEYDLYNCASEETFEGVYVSANLVAESNEIILEYIISDQAPTLYYPKDEVEPERYIAGGVEHYITVNEGEYRATWINGNVMCKIYGTDSKTELLKMMDSIYLEG